MKFFVFPIALGAKEPYDFTKWQPNYVFINLGTNDCGAFSQPAWTDETTGETFQNRRTEDGKLNPEDEARFAHGATAFFEVMDDGQEKRFVFSADGREPAETMDFLRVEPVDA